jgi:mRNA interferase HigB
VRIVSKKAIAEYGASDRRALPALMHWYDVAVAANWLNLADVRQDFPSADSVGRYTAFNIGGDKYRLIVVIKYRYRIIYIRHILTHKLYDLGKWSDV